MSSRRIMQGAAVFIALLCLSMCLWPGVQQVAATQEHQSTITVSGCGLGTTKEKTVHLTETQYQTLTQSLAALRTRLANAVTTQEAAFIIRQMLRTLDSFHLLPLGVTLAQLETLITATIPYHTIPLRADDFNAVAVVTGQLSELWYVPQVCSILFSIGIISLILALIGFPTYSVYGMFQTIANHILERRTGPVSLFDALCTGNETTGWIASLGLYGIKYWTGPLTGGLRHPTALPAPLVWGFTGLKLTISDNTTFFLGTALQVGKYTPYTK